MKTFGVRRRTILLAVGTIAITFLSSLTLDRATASGTTPGTKPEASTAQARTVAPDLAATTPAGGLRMVVNERGHVSRSIAGVTSDTTAGGVLTINKPAGATVRGAYFAIATRGFTATPLTDPLTIDGQPVALDNNTPSGIRSYNYFTNVTSITKPKIDAAPAGPVSLLVAEPQPNLTDGEILVVIYDDPAVTIDETISIMYGALSPTGDHYAIQLTNPISLADSNTKLEMSLGISYSYQANGSQQYSSVDVNSSRLTTAAGGEDDGLSHDGALLTAGGEGDSIDNPADPQARPLNPRSDDELYDLRPFVHSGDTSIDIQTSNSSLDDNVFLAVFAMNPPVQQITTGSRTCVQHGAGGWTFSATVSDTDGLVVDHARLGPRLLTRRLSVPYLKITGDWTGHDPTETRVVELTPDGGSGHTGSGTTTLLAPGLTCGSVDTTQPIYVKGSPGGSAPVESLDASATYEVNGLPPGVVVWVQQKYQFQSRADGDACEPSAALPCHRFWPTVTWGLDDSQSAGGSGSFLRLGSVQVVQRFEFDPDAGGDPDLVGRSRGNLFRDKDLLSPGGIVTTLGNGYMRREARQEVINFGQRLPTVTWDSWHQTDRDIPASPGISSPGCSECVHAHWSWGNMVNKPYPGFTDAQPEILNGSHQDDYLAVVKYSPDVTEVDPWQRGYEALVDPTASIADHRIVVFWDSTVNGPSDGATGGVRINQRPFSTGDATWPHLSDVKHGGNGSIFFGPARDFSGPVYAGIFHVGAPIYSPTPLDPRLPAGWVLPVKVTNPPCPRGPDLLGQGPFWIGVQSRGTSGPQLLNPEWAYAQYPGGTPYVTLRKDSLTEDSNLAFEPGKVVRDLDCGESRTAYLVFDTKPSPADVTIRLFAAPNGPTFAPALVD